VLVSQSWISTLFSFQPNHYYPLDFRTAASSQFQVIASLCRFAAQSISDAVKTVSKSQLVTVSALSRTTFDKKSEAVVQNLQTATIADASLIDEYIAFSIAQNYLSSALRTTDFHATSANVYQGGSEQYLWDQNSPGESIDDFCFCYETYSCNTQAFLFNLTLPYNEDWTLVAPPLSFYVPGIKAGCIPHESIMNSTLECFYNLTCIKMLMQFIGSTTFPDPLDATVQSRFQPNMTIRSMFAELLIEDWHYTSNFTGYFATCAPASCSYTYTERFDAAYAIITFLGFIGGITIILSYLASFLVKNVVRGLKRMCCCRQAEFEQQILSINDEAVVGQGQYSMITEYQ